MWQLGSVRLSLLWSSEFCLLLSPYVHSWFPSGNRVAQDAPLGAVWERWSVAKNDTGKSREGSVAYQPLEGIRVGLLAHVLLFWWGSSGQQRSCGGVASPGASGSSWGWGAVLVLLALSTHEAPQKNTD
jgi:hypothetical protein